MFIILLGIRGTRVDNVFVTFGQSRGSANKYLKQLVQGT